MTARVLKFTSAILLLFTMQVSAQNFQGVATYQTKTVLDIDLTASGIPASRIQYIKEMMKSRLEKTYKLRFNKSESIYKEEEKLDNAGGRGMSFMMFDGGASGIHYKNIQAKKSTKENEFSGKNFLIKDDLTNYEWKMEQETKTIGNYLCFKATAVVKMPAPREMKFGRGRPNEKKSEVGSEKEKKEESSKPELVDTIVSAWYTLDIPAGHGPGDYYGLPGLILELSYGNTNVLCTKIVLNPKEKMEINEPKKGKVVTQEEYDKIIQEKMLEMRERMRNERQKGGNNSRRIRIGG